MTCLPLLLLQTRGIGHLLSAQSNDLRSKPIILRSLNSQQLFRFDQGSPALGASQ